MRVVEQHSHLNGFEHILVHKPQIWQEIIDVVGLVDAESCQTEDTQEPSANSQSYISVQELNRRFHQGFANRGWHEPRTSDSVLFETDLVKDRIAVKPQFGARTFGPYDTFAVHMAFYVGDVIDVGVEVLPMKAMSAHMSSGISYYEGELYNVMRQGRGVPAVPLVLIGVAP